jgi:4-amino-4-deoxy-L-arabinose transferase-like glycosyltransferase
MPRRHAALFLGTLLAALGCAWWYWRRTADPLAQAADTAAYDAVAVALLDLAAQPTLAGVAAFAREAVVQQRAPLYPVFLAAIYAAAGGVDHHAATFGSLTCFAITAGGVAVVAARRFGTAVGVAAAALMMLNPDLLFWSHFVLTEIPFALLLLGLALLLEPDHGARVTRPSHAAVAGAVAGLAALTRAAMLIYVGAIVLWLALASGRARGRVTPRSPLAFLAAFALVIAPWLLLASAAVGRFVAVTEQGASLFCTANSAAYLQLLRAALSHGAAGGIPGGVIPVDGCPSLMQRLLPPWPGAMTTLQLYPLKLYYHLQFFNWSNVPSLRVSIWAAAYWSVLWALILAAFVRERAVWRRPGVWLAAGNLFLQPVLNVEPYFRFRAPIEPLLVLIAAEGFAVLRRRRRDVAGRARPPAGAVVATS